MQEPDVRNLNNVTFQSIDKGLSDAVALSNQQLQGSLEELDNSVNRLDNEIKNRTVTGTTLKVIVVVSRVVIATSFLTNWNWVIQRIGGFISLITAVERIFGNVDILLTKVAGRDQIK